MKLLVGAFATLLAASTVTGMQLTMLTVDNFPCQAEQLENAESYSCDSEGNVLCNNGWADLDPNKPDPFRRCTVPVCDPACKRGVCRSHNRCACESGWKGIDCGQCIDKPGCDRGECKTAGLECVCHEGYEGGLCDRPSCSQNCQPNGQCSGPGICTCYDGWTGYDCKRCKKFPGCLEGDCVDPITNVSIPNACICKSNWGGRLCDQPRCQHGCTAGKGVCRMIDDKAFCLCKSGYTGAACEQCQVYPGCPVGGTCTKPYGCDCKNVTMELRNVHCGIDEKI